MLQFLAILGLATLGSILGWSVQEVYRRIADAASGGSLVTGSEHAEAESWAAPDPVVPFGFILSCYGVVAVGAVGAFPGAMALSRTILAFGLLCVGGIISEIARTGTTARLPSLDGHCDTQARPEPVSLCLSLALVLMLNSTVAVLSYGEGLIDLIPAHAMARAQSPERGDDIPPPR